MMAQKPLTLKQFLDLDLNSESCRCTPRRPRGALTWISAAIRAFKLMPLSSTCSRQNQGRFIPRSFWKRRSTEEVENIGKIRVRDIVRLRSFQEKVDGRRTHYFPSPAAASSCSSSSEDGESSGSDFLPSSCDSSECSADNDAAAGKGESPNKQEQERDEMEKEQLSPTSIVEFPSYDDEDGIVEGSITPPCFHQALAHIERTKQQLIRKIRRFEGLADLAPVNLDTRFASLDDEDSVDYIIHVATDEESTVRAGEIRARGLLRQLKAQSPWGPQCRSAEKLLADFFEERLSCSHDGSSSLLQRRRTAAEVEEKLVKEAGEWISGGGACAADDGEAQRKEMESIGGWRCYEVEGEELAADLAGKLLGSIMEELVLDLVPC